jgi:serine/threonine protein kinase
MFDQFGHVKLVDFGLSSTYQEGAISQSMKRVGSLPYMAPELLVKGTGGRQTDWFSYGVLAYELFTCHSPWTTLVNKKQLTIDILTRDISLPRNYSQGAQDFIRSILCKDYMRRLGTCRDTEIRKATFFRNVDWKKTLALKAEVAFIPTVSVKSAISALEYDDDDDDDETNADDDNDATVSVSVIGGGDELLTEEEGGDEASRQEASQLAMNSFLDLIEKDMSTNRLSPTRRRDDIIGSSSNSSSSDQERSQQQQQQSHSSSSSSSSSSCSSTTSNNNAKITRNSLFGLAPITVSFIVVV